MFERNLYTENDENVDFSLKNMCFEWKMNDFCKFFDDHLYTDNGEYVDFSRKNNSFSIKNDDFLHDLFNVCRPSMHRERRKQWFCSEKKKNMNLEWKMNDFYAYFLDHLHIDNGEDVDFSRKKNDDFSINNDDFFTWFVQLL